MTSKTIFMNCMIIGLFHFNALFIGSYTAYDWYLEKDHLKLKKKQLKQPFRPRYN